MRTLMLLAFWLLASPVLGQSLNGKPFLAVQGTASTEVVPDTFPLKVTLNETSLEAEATQARVEALSREVLKIAGDMRIPDRDIEVHNLSISPQLKYDDDSDTSVFIGNEYERVIKLTFHRLSELRDFVGKLPTGKLVRVETEAFTYSKIAEVRRTLRRQAIEDARRSAVEMANAVGKKLLTLHNVSDRAQGVSYSSGFGGAQLGTVEVAGSRADGGHRVDVVLREGVIKVSADAYLVYLIGD